MQIKLTQAEELKILASIYTDAYNSLNIGEQWDNESALKLLEHLFKEQSDLFFTAWEENTIVGGIVSLTKPWWDGIHLVDGELFVSPPHQGKGIGTMLVEHMFEKASLTYNAISWDTFTHRVYEHPLKWYKSLGFEEISQWVMITGDIKKVLETLKKR